MLAFTSVYFGAEKFDTSPSFHTCSFLLKNLAVLAKDAQAPAQTRFRLHLSLSKIATPVSPAEAHTVCRTPNTDDRIGGVPPTLAAKSRDLSAARRAQILTT